MPHILIIEPASAGTQLVAAALHAGHRVTLTTAGIGPRMLAGIDRESVDRVLIVDGDVEAAVLAAVRAENAKHPFDAVAPGVEYYVPLAAQVAAELGLPGIDTHDARVLRDKRLMRERLLRAGLATPRYRAIDIRAADLRDRVGEAVEHVGSPCVVKPVDLADSTHVRLASTIDEATAAISRIAECAASDRDRRPSPVALIEEFIDGPEFSAEGYVTHGGVHVVSITRKLLGSPPHFVERGHIVNAPLPPAEQAAIEKYVADVVAAFGLTVGVFHAELRIGPQGPTLMEIAARLPGGQICTLIKLTTGFDLPAAFIDCLLGGAPKQFSRDGDPQALAGIRFLHRPGTSCYARSEGLDAVRTLEGHHSSAVAYAPGEPIPALSDSTGRLGWHMFTAADLPTLEARLARADEMTVFHAQ